MSSCSLKREKYSPLIRHPLFQLWLLPLATNCHAHYHPPTHLLCYLGWKILVAKKHPMKQDTICRCIIRMGDNYGSAQTVGSKSCTFTHIWVSAYIAPAVRNYHTNLIRYCDMSGAHPFFILTSHTTSLEWEVSLRQPPPVLKHLLTGVLSVDYIS